MNKSSTSYLLKCYIWLVNTIARGPVSRQEIDSRWSASSVNDYKTDSIPESTFHRWRNIAEDLFDIEIQCNAHGEYYIDNASDIRRTNLNTHLLQMFAVNQMLQDSKDLQRQILFEPVPAGEQLLPVIIESLRDKRVLRITHQSFHKSKPSTFPVHPYCLKMFRQRWYMLAFSPDTDDIRTYALDRIQAVEPTTKTYSIPNDFDAEEYFKNSFGVSNIRGKVENIEIKIEAYQANYLRTLPLHSSQQEIERNEAYSVFRYRIVPSFEFIQELRKYGSALEVLQPQRLRDQLRKDSECQLSKYQD